MAKLTAISAWLLLVLAASASGHQTVPVACPANLANRIAETRAAAQLVTVVAADRRATAGALRLWRKAGQCWLAVAAPWRAHLGRNGLSAARREGDKTTPMGAFAFQRVMYGVGPNPGVRYAYHRIVCGDWWVEDPRSPYYNRFRHVPCGSKPPFRTTSEDMSRSPASYRHLVVIDFNAHPIVRGIFLHVSTGRATLGCISLPRAQLVATLRWLDPAASPLIVVGTEATLTAY
jgi:L,D-peptidoglycan transpeptidase YkuD (ErfK/YbiS/YcfS/YnhG family)